MGRLRECGELDELLDAVRCGGSRVAITIGSDAGYPDSAVSVARSGHDLAAKPSDLGGMRLRINPQGNRRLAVARHIGYRII